MHGYVPQPPSINFKHIDGPLLSYSDGQMHWLTWHERLLVWIGFFDAWELQWRRRPDLHLITSVLWLKQAGS